MPRKGKKSQASKVRWLKISEYLSSKQAEPVEHSDPYSNREVNVSEPSNANVTCVLASRSQNHPTYHDANSHCSCNAATFLAFLHELSHLKSADLDLVLDGGYTMYGKTVKQFIDDERIVDGHLNRDELPEVVLGYRLQHIMTKCDSMYGTFTSSPAEGPFINLAARLECLSSGVNSALLVMSNVFVAVFRDLQARYGFFDPHTRRPNGHPTGPDGTGTAVMLTFKHLRDLQTKHCTIFTMLGTSPEAQYELIPVLFQSVDEASVNKNVVHVNSNADTAVSHTRGHIDNTKVSVTQPDIEMSLPSCSVTQSTPCVDIRTDGMSVLFQSVDETSVDQDVAHVDANADVSHMRQQEVITSSSVSLKLRFCCHHAQTQPIPPVQTLHQIQMN